MAPVGSRLVVALVAVLLSLSVVGAAVGPLAHPPEVALISLAAYRAEPGYTQSGQAEADRLWVAEGTVPGATTRWEDMARWALVDIRSFTAPNGAVAAGPGGPWSYFWPRDGSFVAVALAQTGHPGESAAVLDRLARLEFDPTMGFQARYRLDGTPLTDRDRQSDGCGWVLWAIREVRRASPTAVPPAAKALRDRCVRTLTRLVDDGHRLPPPSPDYWEQPVDRTSLGSVAPMLAGLRAAAADYHATGEQAAGLAAGLAADSLAQLVAREFGPGYERFGDEGGVDAAIAMLLPPFAPADEVAPHVRSALAHYQRAALEPAGGLSPGAGWGRHDGNSWTPETALVALSAAASGRTGEATRWLDWLAAHRTAYGSLPEKVTRTGRPGGPAPLLWTAALVLLTLDELDHH